MIELSKVKQKLTLPFLLIILLYVAALIVGVAVLLPNKKATGNLQTEVEQLLRNERNLVGIVEQKPGLEKKKADLGEQLVVQGRMIPTQYDLPEVLDVFAQLAIHNGLKITNLAHVPLQLEEGTSAGVIPMTLQLTGNDLVLSYLRQLQETFPSLIVEEVVLTFKGNGQYAMAIRSKLRVFVVEHADLSHWELPSPSEAPPSRASIVGFGRPFELVSKFLDKNVRVLGVVNGNGHYKALVSKDGKERWLEAGDSLDEAVVSEIYPSGIMLNVDGVLLNLRIGG